MIELLEITKHGKYNNTAILTGETIKCPDCDSFGIWITGFFTVEAKTDNSFSIICHACDCEFLVKVE